MTVDFIPWFLLATSLATILIMPLLSAGPPHYPDRAHHAAPEKPLFHKGG
jgi:hypothetical protein